IAIWRFKREGVPVTLRIAAPAHVLYQHDIAVAGKETGIENKTRSVLVIGRPFDQHRKKAGNRVTAHRREVDVRCQLDAIPHRHHHVAFDRYRKRLPRPLIAMFTHACPLYCVSDAWFVWPLFLRSKDTNRCSWGLGDRHLYPELSSV